MKLFIARHGETVQNDTGVIQGWLDGELNEVGIEQAKKLGLALEKIKPTLILTSDLGRCVETYKYATEESTTLAGVRLLKDWRVRERSFGSLEGDPSAGVDWASFWKRDDDAQQYGEETNRTVRRRVARFVHDLEIITNKNSIVAIITHGGVVNILKNFEMGPDFVPMKYPNAELFEVDYESLVMGAESWHQNNRGAKTTHQYY